MCDHAGVCVCVFTGMVVTSAGVAAVPGIIASISEEGLLLFLLLLLLLPIAPPPPPSPPSPPAPAADPRRASKDVALLVHHQLTLLLGVTHTHHPPPPSPRPPPSLLE